MCGSPKLDRAMQAHMYTGEVVRSRIPALALGLWLSVMPVLSVLCEMDCDRVPGPISCHQAASLPGGPTARSAHHACDHAHTTGSPALLTSISPRDAVGAFALGPVATPAHPSIAADARIAIAAPHEPLGDRHSRTSSRAPILRI